MGEIVIDDKKADGTRDYGTNCLDCERYKRVGEVCVLEHGKRHLSDYCRDFEPIVQLPDYNELMKSVKQDMAAQRQKEKEKKERERKQRQKDRAVKKEERRRMRISRARKRYLALQKKKEKERVKKKDARIKSVPQHVETNASRDEQFREVPKIRLQTERQRRKDKTDVQSIPFARSSFVSDEENKSHSKKTKSHSSNTPSTASSASATA